jgi:hypothetical protein
LAEKTISGGAMTGAGSKPEILAKVNDILAEVTKEVMRLTFFLNYGGVAATLTAFGSTSFTKMKCQLVCCLYAFLIGIVFSVLMALALWWTTSSTYRWILRTSSIIDIPEKIQNSFARKLVWISCILSLILFGVGISVGFNVLYNI